MEKLRSLQVYRGVAALSVLLFHASGLVWEKDGFDFFRSQLGYGYLGVDFFFVLSGFIIHHIHAKDVEKPKQIGAYLLKRFIRLYPIFWVVMVPIVVVVIWFPAFDFGGVDKSFLGIVSTVLLLPQSGLPVLAVSWTLKHEVIFYTLFGLLILLPRRVGSAVFTIWVLTIVASNLVPIPYSPVATGGPLLALALSPLNLEFLSGMAVSFLFSRFRDVLQQHFRELVILTVATGVFFFGTYLFFGTEYSAFRAVLIGVPVALLILSTAIHERTSGLPNNITTQFLVLMGDSSYSVYLVHFLVLSLAHKLLSIVNAFSFLGYHLATLCILALALGVGIAVHRFLERPLLGHLRGLLLRGESAP